MSLGVGTREDHLLIDVELYMPRSWTDDAKRRREGRVPEDLQFKTKP